MTDTNIKVSSIDDFKRNVEAVITLTDIDSEGNEYALHVRVKKQSLSTLITTGVVPNRLMQKAVSLQNPNRNKKKDTQREMSPELIADSLATMKKIAEAVLIEPKYEDVKDYLTDNHLGQIMNYISGGAESLERFRNEQKGVRRSIDSGEIQSATE